MQKHMMDPQQPDDPRHLPANGQAYLPGRDYRGPIPEQEVEEEIHLRDYLDVLLRRKWLITSVLLLVFVTTLIYTVSQPKLYESFATVKIDPNEQNITKFENLSNEAPRWYSDEFFETQIALITNPTLLERVVERMDLRTHPVIQELFFTETDPGILTLAKTWVRDTLRALVPADEQPSAADNNIQDEETMIREMLAGYLEGGLEVARNGTSSLVGISFLSEDPGLSRDVIINLMEAFIEWSMEEKLTASERAQVFLMKQIARAKINLEKAEKEMNRFAKQAGIVSMDGRQNSILLELEELNAAMAAAEADMISKEAVYQQAVADGPANLPQVLANPMIGELKAEYARLQSEYEQMSVTMRDDYPTVKSVKARMASIAERIQAEERKIFQALANEYQTARKRLARIKERAETQKQTALDLNQRATQYRIMAREVDTNKNIYESLLERSREIESIMGVSSSNISIVRKASLPKAPAQPNVRRNLLLAIVVGLMGGVGLAFFLEYFMDAVTDPDEIADRFQMPILGLVPLVKSQDYPLEKTFIHDPRAPLSEAMRMARVSLKLSGTRIRSKSVLITSNRPGEGKTTLATNLALTFAGAGEKVVLVDADMRRPRVHKIFDPEADGRAPGLSSFLAGVTARGIIQKNGHQNLRFIAAGPIPPNPAELLTSPRFDKLMRHLEKHFDRVIVDAPPHQGFADVLVLSQNVGGVVLITSMGETKREELRQFKRNMVNNQGTILGVLINKVDMTRRYGYHSHYRYYQYYRYGEDARGPKKLPSKT